MDKDQKVAYIKEHPKSKFAKQKLKEDKKKGKADKKAEKKAAKKANPSKASKAATSIKASMKNFSHSQQKFFKGDGHKPESKERRSFGKFMKDKAKGIVKAIKAEGAEWKDAGSAIKKIATGGKPTKHEKHALKTVAIHAAMVVGPMAISGGLSAGLAGMSKGLAVGMLEHSALIRAAQVAVFASADKIDEDSTLDEAMEHFVAELGEAFATAKISEADWVKAANGADKE